MIDIDLVTGFLGSGKTSFIIHYGQYLIDQGLKIAIIENDFGAINVDMMILSQAFQDKCHLEMIINDGDRQTYQRRLKAKLIALKMQNFDRIIIEPSGLFEIDDLQDTLYQEPLNSWYRIANVYALVDSQNHHLSPVAKSMFTSQVLQAGAILLTKEDLASDLQIQQTRDYLNQLLSNKEIPIIDYQPHSFYDYASLMKSGYHSLTVPLTQHYRETFQSLFIMNQSFTIEKCLDIIQTLFDDCQCGQILRIKGFVNDNDTWYQINATSQQMTCFPVDIGQDVIIIIGEDLNEDTIFQHFK